MGRALLLFALGCATPPAAEAPPAPGTELRFAEFFETPVGPRGLTPTAKLRALNGERVTVEGAPVREQEPFPGLFMMTAMPVTLAERADGPADLLPPATLFVHLPERDRGAVPYLAESVRVTGTLELGAREESSGRISYVRLRLDDLRSTQPPLEFVNENPIEGANH